MRRPSGRLAMTLVLALLGFLVVVQLRVQSASPGLAGLTAQELTVLVANLSTRNEQLIREVETLSRQAQSLALAGDRGQTTLGQMRADLDRIRAFTGLDGVTGPGVRVTVSGVLPGEAVAYLLNELRNAGAEAIAVEDVRVVPGVVVTGAAGELTVAGQALADPFAITAIGSPEALTGSLGRIGGPIAQLAATYPDALVEVEALERVTLPPTLRPLRPVHGRPRI